MNTSPSKGAVENNDREFALHVVSGMTYCDAYKMIHPGVSPSSSKTCGSNTAKKPEVIELIRKLRDEIWDAKKLSFSEKLAFNADVVRCKVGDMIDAEGNVKEEYGHLCQEVQIVQGANGEIATKVKIPSKAEIIRLDNSMQGHDQPVKISGSLTLESLLAAVPTEESSEDWELDTLEAHRG